MDCHRICYVNKEVSFWKLQFSSIISCFSSYHNTFNFIQFMVKLIHGAYKSICVLEKNARIQCINLKLELNSILSEHSAVSWVLTRTWGLHSLSSPFSSAFRSLAKLEESPPSFEFRGPTLPIFLRTGVQAETRSASTHSSALSVALPGRVGPRNANEWGDSSNFAKDQNVEEKGREWMQSSKTECCLCQCPTHGAVLAKNRIWL